MSTWRGATSFVLLSSLRPGISFFSTLDESILCLSFLQNPLWPKKNACAGKQCSDSLPSDSAFSPLPICKIRKASWAYGHLWRIWMSFRCRLGCPSDHLGFSRESLWRPNSTPLLKPFAHSSVLKFHLGGRFRRQEIVPHLNGIASKELKPAAICWSTEDHRRHPNRMRGWLLFSSCMEYRH